MKRWHKHNIKNRSSFEMKSKALQPARHESFSSVFSFLVPAALNSTVAAEVKAPNRNRNKNKIRD